MTTTPGLEPATSLDISRLKNDVHDGYKLLGKVEKDVRHVKTKVDYLAHVIGRTEVRIQEMEQSVDVRFDVLEKSVDERFNSVDETLALILARLPEAA